MEQKPSVGRVVHYVSYGTPGGEYASECRAAIVTEIPELVGSTANNKSYVVGLCVLNPTGMFFNREVWHRGSGPRRHVALAREGVMPDA
ncbi:hypothetical protein [Paractinoplanes toevensis]|uniref:Uncharacterized protein n=1 Tax=Paractinoplanes toevensis TaxID=571911 RepID=A0A919T6Z3_9ACTN|nr:hypothetical protein [Actinoplanes toevensis]GIM88889.1 hypothetical protein Ato02nite_006820 [Actinoplanes toevensis]